MLAWSSRTPLSLRKGKSSHNLMSPGAELELALTEPSELAQFELAS